MIKFLYIFWGALAILLVINTVSTLTRITIDSTTGNFKLLPKASTKEQVQ